MSESEERELRASLNILINGQKSTRNTTKFFLRPLLVTLVAGFIFLAIQSYVTSEKIHATGIIQVEQIIEDIEKLELAVPEQAKIIRGEMIIGFDKEENLRTKADDDIILLIRDWRTEFNGKVDLILFKLDER